MKRLLLFLPSVLLVAGCYTNIVAPGAVGKVVDADTGAPVRGAHVTRPYTPGGLAGGVCAPSGGLPPASVTTDRTGRFDLAPATETRILFMVLKNPKSVLGSFSISAEGYTSNNVEGTATRSTSWRVPLASAPLKHQ